MANKVIVSKSNSLSWRDVGKSWVMLVALPVLQGVIELIVANGSFRGIDWERMLISTLSATFLFLAQRFGGKAKVVTEYDTNEKAVEVAEDIKK